MMKKATAKQAKPCAVIYTRVSTEEQASQQHNLPAQERKCVEYCTRNSLEPLRVFTDAESGRTDDRPQFQAMIRFCREHRDPKRERSATTTWVTWSKIERDHRRYLM